MIPRYTLPEMGAIWTDEARMRAWLQVEVAAVRAWSTLGKVPPEAVAEIEAKADFDAARVAEIEKTTDHDVIAFLTNVAEHVGPASRHVHEGLTSSDVVDTGLALQMTQAADILIALRNQRLEITNATIEEPSLDDVFMALTGHPKETPVAENGARNS